MDGKQVSKGVVVFTVYVSSCSRPTALQGTVSMILYTLYFRYLNMLGDND